MIGAFTTTTSASFTQTDWDTTSSAGHFAPKWFMNTPDYVPYRCTEHDKPIQMTSLWAPGTLKIYDKFYKELSDHYSNKLAFISLSTPSEFGEIGYPLGMTTPFVKQNHSIFL
ncbi:MAG: hypothetical protein ACYC0V_19010 [Armatimonadota bacterium]